MDLPWLPKADSPYAGRARRLLMEVEELTEERVAAPQLLSR
jgi:hypothetical protein